MQYFAYKTAYQNRLRLDMLVDDTKDGSTSFPSGRKVYGFNTPNYINYIHYLSFSLRVNKLHS